MTAGVTRRIIARVVTVGLVVPGSVAYVDASSGSQRANTVGSSASGPADPVVEPASSVVPNEGRGVDDVAAVQRASRLVSTSRAVLGSGEGLLCLSGDGPVGAGCVVAQLQPKVTAASACMGLGGQFLVREGSTNGSGLVSFSYEVPAAAGVVPSTIVADAAQGQTFSWVFSPTSPTADCPTPSVASWRSFRVDVVRSGVEESFDVGPISVGLSSGSMTMRVSSTKIALVSGSSQLGLAYRSPGGVGYESEDPTQVLPDGWSLDGLGGVAPWVSVRQVGSGNVPAAVVLTAFDGQQVEFTNTLAGTGATAGSWAAPTQAGWPSGQFGSLLDSGDLTAVDSTFTWSSGQQVVTFALTAPGVWGVVESRQVEPSGVAAASVSVRWDTNATPPRLAGLADPTSPRRVTFFYGADGNCNGNAPPVDGSDTYDAPDGLLCGWSDFDEEITNVWYSKVADSTDATDGYQIGWVVGPGGVNTQLSWTSDGGLSWPQLSTVQTPLGHDAQGFGLAESASVWSVDYDAFGNVQSVVSPEPGVESVVAGANNDRVARFFTYNDSQGVQWTTISHGQVAADSHGGLEVTPGATMIDEVRYDGAWRPVRYAVASSRPSGGFFIMNQVWDAARDRLVAVAGPDGRQVAAQYDYLGREINRWGPAPTTSFTTDTDGDVVPAPGFGTANLITSSSTYDAGPTGELAGLTVSMFTGSTPGGVPAGTLGSCVTVDSSVTPPVTTSLCGADDAPPLSWTTLSSSANVSGGGWSMNAVASRQAPVDGDQLRYRVSTDGDGSVLAFSANGSCNTDFTSASCAVLNGGFVTVAASPATRAGDPVTLQVQYRRGATAVSQAAPVEVRIEESSNGGAWTALTARDLDPGFGLTTSNTQFDTYSTNGDVVSLAATVEGFDDPQRQQVSEIAVSADGVSASMKHTYEGYDGSSTWGRTSSTTDLAGTTVAASYWGPEETTTNPCDGTTSVEQSGLQATFTTAATTTGNAAGAATRRVYDLAGRPIAQTHTSEDDQATVTVCTEYDGRDQPSKMATSDGTLSSSFEYPWNDPDASDALTTTATHTAPDTSGATRTYTSTTTVDLLGRTVSATGPWGTTTVTDYAVDPASGVRTTTATSTTAAGFVVTERTVIDADGTTASVTRNDGTTVSEAVYAYNADSTIGTITINTVDPSGDVTEIVTETRSYAPTTGAHSGSTWTRDATTLATDQITDAPNAMRILGETLTIGDADPTTYSWTYTYGGLARLTGAVLTSSDNSISGTWDYAFTPDTGARAGENPNAHLNGNISSKTVTLNGGDAETVEYHYDFADRLTRSTDAELQGLVYDSFGNLTSVGANTITYNTHNAPIRVTDGTTTVGYTRLIDYSLIEKTTTSAGNPVTIRYSQSGLVLNTSGDALAHIHQLGSVTVTAPVATGIETAYQLNTITGNRLLTLDETGTPTDTTPALFDPYGTPLTTTTTPNADSARVPDFAWSTAERAETEALELPYVMMGARIYLPAMGRFTSPDPVPGSSGSEYSYARSDPINFNDPNGLSPKWWRAFTNAIGEVFTKHFWTTDIRTAWDWAFDYKHGGAFARVWHVATGVVTLWAIAIVVVMVVLPLVFGAIAGTALVIGYGLYLASALVEYAAAIGEATIPEQGVGLGDYLAETGTSYLKVLKDGVATIGLGTADTGIDISDADFGLDALDDTSLSTDDDDTFTAWSQDDWERRSVPPPPSPLLQ